MKKVKNWHSSLPPDHPLEILRCKEIEKNRRNFLKRAKIDPAEIEEIMKKTSEIETSRY
jgi:hypothetical protein